MGAKSISIAQPAISKFFDTWKILICLSKIIETKKLETNHSQLMEDEREKLRRRTVRSIVPSGWDGTEEAAVLAGTAAATVVTSLRGRTGSGGSRPGKKANIDRADAEGAALL